MAFNPSERDLRRQQALMALSQNQPQSGGIGQGAISGAAAGSAFGPKGALIGAGIGTGLGVLQARQARKTKQLQAKIKKEEDEIRIEQAKQDRLQSALQSMAAQLGASLRS